MKQTFIAFAIASSLFGCSKELPPIPEPESRPAKILTVSVGDARYSRSFPATSEAGERAVLAFRVPGLMESIDVTAGQKVQKGDELAHLNPDEYQLLKQQAKANFRLADVQYQRYKKLREDKVVSEQDYDQALANHSSALAKLNQASANLGYTKLVAPYDGTISLVIAEDHEYIEAKTGVMNIQTDQLLKVIFQLPDYLLSRFATENAPEVKMTFDAFPNYPFPLSFLEVDTEADPKTGSYRVTMVMSRPQDIGIFPGMSGNVEVVVQRSGATILPQEALLKDEGKIHVWRVDNTGITSKVAVELNANQQVVSGLNSGDRIIASGVSDVTEGSKVREWIKERGL